MLFTFILPSVHFGGARRPPVLRPTGRTNVDQIVTCPGIDAGNMCLDSFHLDFIFVAIMRVVVFSVYGIACSVGTQVDDTDPMIFCCQSQLKG